MASLYRAKDMSDAIAIANNSIFGLGACAWTNDAAERELFINEMSQAWHSSMEWWPLTREFHLAASSIQAMDEN